MTEWKERPQRWQRKTKKREKRLTEKLTQSSLKNAKPHTFIVHTKKNSSTTARMCIWFYSGYIEQKDILSYGKNAFMTFCTRVKFIFIIVLLTLTLGKRPIIINMIWWHAKADLQRNNRPQIIIKRGLFKLNCLHIYLYNSIDFGNHSKAYQFN